MQTHNVEVTGRLLELTLGNILNKALLTLNELPADKTVTEGFLFELLLLYFF